MKFKQITISAIALGFFSSVPAEAAIVTGTVSGIWESNYYQDGRYYGQSKGDAFRAIYTYDNANPISTQNDSTTDFQNFYQQFSLLSLIVDSGSFRHTFDLTGVGTGYLYLAEQTWLNPNITSYSYGYIGLSAVSESSSATEDFFYIDKRIGEYGGTPFDTQLVSGYSYDKITRQYGFGGRTTKANFSPDPTAIPTPALLPGLIGMGVAAWRKRKTATA